MLLLYPTPGHADLEKPLKCAALRNLQWVSAILFATGFTINCSFFFTIGFKSAHSFFFNDVEFVVILLAFYCTSSWIRVWLIAWWALVAGGSRWSQLREKVERDCKRKCTYSTQSAHISKPAPTEILYIYIYIYIYIFFLTNDTRDDHPLEWHFF